MCQHANSGASRPEERPEAPSMHAFIGLGNPGVRYANTRHNAGFDVIDTWLRRLGLELAPVSERFHGAVAKIGGLPVALVKPVTFMNRSGYAVREAVGHYELDVNRIVVVCDDVNLPFGMLRLRAEGQSWRPPGPGIHYRGTGHGSIRPPAHRHRRPPGRRYACRLRAGGVFRWRKRRICPSSSTGPATSWRCL